MHFEPLHAYPSDMYDQHVINNKPAPLGRTSVAVGLSELGSKRLAES